MVAATEEKPAGQAKPLKKGVEPPEELSEEDQKLQTTLEVLVERVTTENGPSFREAVDAIATEIRTATSSMTSVPKPLKFLHPHFSALCAAAAAPGSRPAADGAALCDVLSVLAMTAGRDEDRDCLHYCLRGSLSDVSQWGHEYVRHLSGEVGEEWAILRERGTEDASAGAGAAAMEVETKEGDAPVVKHPPAAPEQLLALVSAIVPHNMRNHAEPEAVDLLLEVERVSEIVPHVDASNGARTAAYLLACAGYLPEPEDAAALQAAHAVLVRVGRACDALRVALRLRRRDLAQEAFLAAGSAAARLQCAYVLGGALEPLPSPEQPEAGDAEAAAEARRSLGVEGEEEYERLVLAASNVGLSERYLALARELDVLEPKAPEDVYKSHLLSSPAPAAAGADSARANLAATFVNAFVNAGFGADALVLPRQAAGEGAASAGEEVHWIFRNKDHGKLSAAASLGAVSLWDADAGLPAVDRFLYSADPQVVGGALLATGLVCSRVASEVDPAYAVIVEHLSRPEPPVVAGAALGLGLAYAGRRREDVAEALLPLAGDGEEALDAAVHAALAASFVWAGQAHGPTVEALLQALMLRGEAELQGVQGWLLALALGVQFLRRQEAVEPTLEVVRTLPKGVREVCLALLPACAYAASGDVLQIQALLDIAGGGAMDGEEEEGQGQDKGAEDKRAGEEGNRGSAPDGGEAKEAAKPAAKDSSAPSPPSAKPPPPPSNGPAASMAVLGIALVAGAEELGVRMAQRALEHLLQYGDAHVRRAVPLACALLFASDPEQYAGDMLGRLSHDADADVAAAAVLALGIVGAGTNHARLAGALRGLSAYYAKLPAVLFLVRVAQGLLHAGKGLLTLSPYAADRAQVSDVALAGLLTVLVAGLDARAALAGRMHPLLYCLFLALRPRMLMTVDEAGEPLPAAVRVGQAVDVVAQAGRPKTVTGFQTHDAPVLLAAKQRAELGTERYVAHTQVLEDVVVLSPNPDWVQRDE